MLLDHVVTCYKDGQVLSMHYTRVKRRVQEMCRQVIGAAARDEAMALRKRRRFKLLMVLL